jgi:hypothetical protein
MSCPPPAPAQICAPTGCIPDFSQPSAKLTCPKFCSGGGNLPNGPLVPCPACPGPQYPADCPANLCALSPLARIIITIVQIRDANGVTNDQILAEHNDVVCPQNPLTSAQVSRYVNLGVQRGALRRVASGGVRVYAFFGDLPSNLTLAEELGVYYQLCLGLFCDNGR